MIKHFYIFRHGESTFNLVGRVQGCSDQSVLTAKGRLQAHNTATILDKHHLQIIISSPLQRAIETGTIVAEHIHVPLDIDKRFIEVNIGMMEGLLYEDVITKHAELYQKWRNSETEDNGFCFPGGESKMAVRQRIFDALNDYALHTDYTDIGISGHGITLKQSLRALGFAIDDIPNGSVLHLEYADSQWHTDGILHH